MSLQGNWASGANVSFLFDFEASYKVAKGVPAGNILPFDFGTTYGAQQKLSAANTSMHTREPVTPIPGNIDLTGDFPIPLDAIAFGWWLKAAFGAVVDAPLSPMPLDHSAVVNQSSIGSGLVGIPCTGHGLLPGMQVLLQGTQHQDGSYVLDPSTTANQLVVPMAAFNAETLAAGTVYLGGVLLSGDVVQNFATGKVGIPAPGHGFQAGDSIIITGSTNYNGTFTVDAATTANEIVIDTAFTAETLAAGVVARPNLYTHTYSVVQAPATLPSFIVEQQIPDLATPAYLFSNGNKVSKMAMKLSGDGELVPTFTVQGSQPSLNTGSYNAEAPVMNFNRFLFTEEFHYLNGVPTLEVMEFDFNLDNGLDPDCYPRGSKGYRQRLADGIVGLNGSLKALFMDTTLLTQAINFGSAPYQFGWAMAKAGLSFSLPTIRIPLTGVPVPNPKGLNLDFNWQAEATPSKGVKSVTATLINSVATYN
jgi:hypothetical protein